MMSYSFLVYPWWLRSGLYGELETSQQSNVKEGSVKGIYHLQK